MNEFKIPDEWRQEFIKAYIPLIASVDSVGIYKEKIDGLSTEEVYKVLYFCEVSSRKEWLEGMTKFSKPHRDLALRYLNCRGTIVPRLAIPFSVKSKKYKEDITKIILFLSLLSFSLTIISKYLWINFIAYLSLVISLLSLFFLNIKNK